MDKAKKEQQDQEQNEPKQLLEINTIAPKRDWVTIDDVKHLLRLTQDFGTIEHQEFGHNSERYDELEAKKKLSNAEKKELDQVQDWLFDHVLLDAPKLREQMSDLLTGGVQREIILAFTNAPLLKAVMAQQAAEKAEQAKKAKNGQGTADSPITDG